MAIGTLGSTLAKSQLVALIISAGMLLFMLLMWMLAAITDRPLRELFLALALYQRHFVPFQSGVIHLRDVVYYVALTYFMLFTAIRVLEARRWR